MELTNYRKETSEGSDPDNWAKKMLEEQTAFHYDSIEGCNQNDRNVITHLMERARVDISGTGDIDLPQVFASIKALEGDDNILLRKINFAQHFGLPLSYVLYCNENEKVFVFNISTSTDIEPLRNFNSFTEFSNWIQEIKVWKSKKVFREEGLPEFDKKLRQAGCAWPTNIDCFVSNPANNPIAILEFQNAQKTKVSEHCNNDYFLCSIKKMQQGQYGPYPVYHDDIRRWTSQEILRVQSSLRFFVITWSKDDLDFILKEIERITIPFIPADAGWKGMNAYKSDLHDYVTNNRHTTIEEKIASKYKTYNLNYSNSQMNSVVNEPPLTYAGKTFPSIYYTYKNLVQGQKAQLVQHFEDLINR